MKIAIGSDKLGYEIKEKIKDYLAAKKYSIADLGTINPDEPIDYVTVADKVSKEIVSNKAICGIVICGSGTGVSIVANKHKGVYCAHVESLWTAKNAREINNVNMLAFGANVIGPGMALDIVDAFMETKFAPGATQERKAMLQGFLDKLQEVEGMEFA